MCDHKNSKTDDYRNSNEWIDINNRFKKSGMTISGAYTYTRFSSCSPYEHNGRWLLENKNGIEYDGYHVLKQDNNICVEYSTKSPSILFLDINN